MRISCRITAYFRNPGRQAVPNSLLYHFFSLIQAPFIRCCNINLPALVQYCKIMKYFGVKCRTSMLNYQGFYQNHRLYLRVCPIVKITDIIQHENWGRTDVTARWGKDNLRKTVDFLSNWHSSKFRSLESKSSYEWRSVRLGVEHPLGFTHKF